MTRALPSSSGASTGAAKGTGCSSAADLALFLEQRLVLWGLVSFGGHKFEMCLQVGGVISLTMMLLPLNP